MNEVLRTIEKLHSTHGNFTSRPVSDEAIETILNACLRTANASNRQSYSIIVIRGDERVKSVLGCGLKSPAALLFCVDFNRIYDIGEYLGYSNNDDHLLSCLTAHTDASIAAQTAVIAAASLGLSSLYTNSVINPDRKSLSELYEQLDLPEEHLFPVIGLLLGYEDKAPEYKTMRLSCPGVVHHDSYKRLTNEQKEAIIQKANDPSYFRFGYKGDNYLEFYYTKWAPAQTAEVTDRRDSFLYEKLKSFIHR